MISRHDHCNTTLRVVNSRARDRRRAYRSLWISLAAIALGTLAHPSFAQESSPSTEAAAKAELDEALGNVPIKSGDAADDSQVVRKTAGAEDVEIDLLELLIDGSWPMLPIVFMLILVLTFTIERFLGLRRSKIIPAELTDAFGELSSGDGGFDPRQAYRVCQQFPCAASNVIRAMLLKIGRPHDEVERAVREANEREAARLYTNVRWLTLAAAVTPLMGLFGTVWGMINAFYATANLSGEVSKAEVLAGGIVIALVTTLGGLFVAIPAAILAHYFEGRIQTLFREMDELLFSLLPQVEQYEGKLRISPKQFSTTRDPEIREGEAPPEPRDRSSHAPPVQGSQP